MPTRASHSALTFDNSTPPAGTRAKPPPAKSTREEEINNPTKEKEARRVPQSARDKGPHRRTGREHRVAGRAPARPALLAAAELVDPARGDPGCADLRGSVVSAIRQRALAKLESRSGWPRKKTPTGTKTDTGPQGTTSLRNNMPQIPLRSRPWTRPTPTPSDADRGVQPDQGGRPDGARSHAARVVAHAEHRRSPSRRRQPNRSRARCASTAWTPTSAASASWASHPRVSHSALFGPDDVSSSRRRTSTPKVGEGLEHRRARRDRAHRGARNLDARRRRGGGAAARAQAAVRGRSVHLPR